MWRPENWKTPQELGKDNMAYRDAFEAGADAMLEALKSKCPKIPALGGTWVFIPNEVEDNG
jgi:hypothetical protein